VARGRLGARAALLLPAAEPAGPGPDAGGGRVPLRRLGGRPERLGARRGPGTGLHRGLARRSRHERAARRHGRAPEPAPHPRDAAPRAGGGRGGQAPAVARRRNGTPAPPDGVRRPGRARGPRAGRARDRSARARDVQHRRRRATPADPEHDRRAVAGPGGTRRNARRRRTRRRDAGHGSPRHPRPAAGPGEDACTGPRAGGGAAWVHQGHRARACAAAAHRGTATERALLETAPAIAPVLALADPCRRPPACTTRPWRHPAHGARPCHRSGRGADPPGRSAHGARCPAAGPQGRPPGPGPGEGHGRHGSDRTRPIRRRWMPSSAR
jgi:hypothetical protein